MLEGSVNCDASFFASNRAKFVSLLRAKVPKVRLQNQVALFKGRQPMHINATDMTYPSYQCASFFYLFGVEEVGCYGVI